MRGFAVDIEPAYAPPAGFTVPVIGVVAAPAYSPEAIQAVLSDGRDKTAPDTLWVVRASQIVSSDARERNGDCVAQDFIWSFTDNVLVLEKDSLRWGDLASDWRDYEMVWGCSRVIVFHRASSSRTSWFVKAGRFFPSITVVEEEK